MHWKWIHPAWWVALITNPFASGGSSFYSLLSSKPYVLCSCISSRCSFSVWCSLTSLPLCGSEHVLWQDLWHSSIVLYVFWIPHLEQPQGSLQTQILFSFKSFWAMKSLWYTWRIITAFDCHGRKSLICTFCQVSKVFLRMSSGARIETHFNRLIS